MLAVTLSILILVALALAWANRSRRSKTHSGGGKLYERNLRVVAEDGEADVTDTPTPADPPRPAGPDGPMTAMSTIKVTGVIDRDAIRERTRHQLELEAEQYGAVPDYAMIERSLSNASLDEMLRTQDFPRFGEHPPEIDATPDAPRSWGGRVAWLAVRASSADEVAKALNLTDTRPCNWYSGVEFGHWMGYGLGQTGTQYPVFVTPPVDGWVLVLQNWAAAERRVDCRTIMAPLSEQFGEVQAFVTHYTSALYAWARAVDGQLVRQTSWCDEKLDNFGALSDGEQALWREVSGHEPPDTSAEFSIRFDFTETSPHDLARHWSVDPRDFDGREDLKARKELGVAGLAFELKREGEL